MGNSWLLIVPWTFVVAGAVVTAWGSWRVIERLRSRRRQRACPKCTYDMHASSDLRCPECGFEAKRESAFRRRRVPWVRWALGIACVGLGSAVLPLRLHDPIGRVQRLPDWVIAFAMTQEDRPLPVARDQGHGWAWEEGMARWHTRLTRGTVRIEFDAEGLLRAPDAMGVPEVPTDRITRGFVARALVRYMAQCDAAGEFDRFSAEYWSCAPVSAPYRDVVMRRIDLPNRSSEEVVTHIAQRFAMGTVTEAEQRRMLAALVAPMVRRDVDRDIAGVVRHLGDLDAERAPAVLLTEALGLSSHLVRVAAAAWARSDAARLERVSQVWRDRLDDADPAQRAAAVMAWSTLHPSDVLVARELAPIAAGDDDLGVALNALAALRLMTRDAQREGISALAEADIQHEAIRRVVAELMQPSVFAEPLSRRMHARRAVRSDRYATRLEYFDDVRLPMGDVVIERDDAERVVVRFMLPADDLPPRWWVDHDFRDAQLRAVHDELCARARLEDDDRGVIMALFQLQYDASAIGPAFAGDDTLTMIPEHGRTHATARPVEPGRPPAPMELRYDVRVWDARLEITDVLRGHVIVTNHGSVPVTCDRRDLAARLVSGVGDLEIRQVEFRTSRDAVIPPGGSIAVAWQRDASWRVEPATSGVCAIECTGNWLHTPRCLPGLLWIAPSPLDARQRIIRFGGDDSGFTVIRRDGVAERFGADGQLRRSVRISHTPLHAGRSSGDTLGLTRDGRYLALETSGGIAIHDLDRDGATEFARLPGGSRLVAFDDSGRIQANIREMQGDERGWSRIVLDLTTGAREQFEGEPHLQHVRPDGGAVVRAAYGEPVHVYVGDISDPDVPIAWSMTDVLFNGKTRVDMREMLRHAPRHWFLNQRITLAPKGVMHQTRDGVACHAWADGSRRWAMAPRHPDRSSGGLLVMDAVDDRLLLAQVHGNWTVIELLLVNATDGTIIAVLPYDGRLHAMFSGDGAHVLVTAYDDRLPVGEFGRTVVIHDAATGERVRDVTLAASDEE